MFKMFGFVVLALLVKSSEAVIYSMNETTYNKMPALYGLDDYTSCLLEPDGMYCVADFGIFAGDPQLLDMIQQYSDHTMKHFNHTQLHRGICVSQTCKQYLFNSSNYNMGLNKTLEVCLNETIWRDYRLQVKLENIRYCKKTGETLEVDHYDMMVGIAYLVIILLNVIGSFYDIMLRRHGEKKGNAYLLAFSLPRNWKKLVAPSSRGTEPRLDRLKLFYGLRTMTIICVFFSHTVLMMALSYVENPLFIEKSYEDPLKQILFNGSLVIQTFFVMSSFLLAYNLEIYSEDHGVGWMQLPKGIIMRWLRLTPAYALVMATVCTWMRHLGSGPMWPLVVESEVVACRQYWWAHLLYINNYIYGDAHCFPQTWYLAADTQLFCFGLLLCVAFRSTRARIGALATSFAVALGIVALHTYIQDLDAVVIQSPETYRNLYQLDDTFRITYIRGHTNVSTYVLGLAGGLLTYRLQGRRKDFDSFKRYRWLFWMAFPLGVATILSGGLFYTDGPRASLGARVLYATLYKPVFQMLVVTLIVGCIFKVETLYRGIMEWRGFTWTGRVSYSAFLLHTLFQRGFVGSQRRPSYMTDYYVVTVLTSTLFMGFLCASALWLLVEAPASGLTRAALSRPERSREADDGE